MKYFSLLLVSFFIIGCNSNDTSLKKGVSWGMSMSQVANQYKTNPSDKGSEVLEFKENYYSPSGGQVEASYTYHFDSQNGLLSYNIFAHSHNQEENDALLDFAKSNISETDGSIVEREESYVAGDAAIGGGFVFERKVVFDRLYNSTKNEAVRVLLEYSKETFGNDSTYDLAISCLAPGWTFKESPSSYRQKHDVTKKRN